jgi:hypothetical protein
MSNYWTDAELARFGYFELEGARSPGVLVEMELGDGTPLKWDEQNGPALSGAFLRYMGLGLAEFKLKLRLVDEKDRAARDGANWRAASSSPIQGQPDRKRSIRHPVLERVTPAINLVTMQSVPFEQPATSEGGGVIMVYPFKAWRKVLQQPTVPLPPENAEEGKVESPFQKEVAALSKSIDAALLEGSGIPPSP